MGAKGIHCYPFKGSAKELPGVLEPNDGLAKKLTLYLGFSIHCLVDGLHPSCLLITWGMEIEVQPGVFIVIPRLSPCLLDL